METILTNTYTRLDQKSKLFETISIVLGQKNYSKEKYTSQKHHFFFRRLHFETFINGMNEGYKTMRKLSYGK